MALSKNVKRIMKRTGKRTQCHPFGIKGGAYGVFAPHWLAYSKDLKPLRAVGPLGLIALMLRSAPRADDQSTITIDPCECPEPAGLQL